MINNSSCQISVIHMGDLMEFECFSVLAPVLDHCRCLGSNYERALSLPLSLSHY